MASALILSLMDTAVKVTPAKPLATFFFRLLEIRVTITITTTSVTTPPTAPAMAAVFDLVGDFVTAPLLGSAVVKSAVREKQTDCIRS